jgi:hypothetical protein
MEVNILFLQKIIFIYNAVINGWTVKQKNNGEFEFIKDSYPATSGNLSDFLESNIQIPEELKNIATNISEQLQ